MATLSNHHKHSLDGFIGKRQDYQLLYKATRDGCDAGRFHSLCDNKGPTVTVLFNTQDTVFGGYTSVSWNSSCNYTQDNNAFLFRLDYNGSHSRIKYPVKKATHAIYCHISYGPYFGYNDFQCFLGTINHNGTCYPLNGYMNVGYSYDMQGHDVNTFNNNNFQVKDLEVYAVKDAPYNTPLYVPWRNMEIEWNTRHMQELQERIELYQPLKELNVPQTNILLIGQVGAGKSSFFNTVNSIFHKSITSQACSGSAEHSLTTVYRMYQVRNGENCKPLNFRLCDTRGLEEDQGIDENELCKLLDGKIPYGYQFNRTDATDIKTEQSPTVSDRIHCVAFVVDASSLEVMPEKVLQRIKAMQIQMNERGIPQVVLLTKIDKICCFTIIMEDVSVVFKSPAVRDMVDKVYQIIGLPRAHILPLKNYECEMKLDENVNILALLHLEQILHFANNYLCNILDELETKTRHGMKINAANFVTETSTVTSEMLEGPWRRFTEWNAKTLELLMESTLKYKPNEEMDIPETRILLIGQLGAGKSSFINTINSIFLGRFPKTMDRKNEIGTSSTMFSVFDVQNHSADQMNFRFCNTPGLEQDQMDVVEFSFLLDGNVPDRCKYNTTVRFSPDVPGFIQNPKPHEKMHCVVFVIYASNVDGMSETVQQQIKALQSKVYQRGICQLVLLTKIDKICPLVSKDVSSVFYSSGIRDAVDKISQKIRMPIPCILPVKNYENEVELDDNISILALHSLNQILNYADEYNARR